MCVTGKITEKTTTKKKPQDKKHHWHWLSARCHKHHGCRRQFDSMGDIALDIKAVLSKQRQCQLAGITINLPLRVYCRESLV